MKRIVQSVQSCATAFTLVFALVTMSAGGGESGNLLKDPGFELQTPPEQGGWSTFNWASFSTDYARSGNASLVMPGYYSVPGAFQQFPAAPGSQWRMTGYAFTPHKLMDGWYWDNNNQTWGVSAPFGIVQISFFDAFGNDLGTVETSGLQVPAKTSNQFNSSSPPEEWIFLNTGIATAPTGTAYVQAFPLYVDFSGYFQLIYFDDLILEFASGNHGQYVAAVTRNAQALQKSGAITRQQAQEMVTQAAKSPAGQGTLSTPSLVASDHADWSYYSPQPYFNWPSVNGGFGFGSWTMLNDIVYGTGSDGGTFMTGLNMGWKQLDGYYSFGVYAWGTGFDLSRPLLSSLSSGRFSISTRFNVAGVGHTLINLRSGNDTSGFSAGELLAFGIQEEIDPTQLSYTDGTGTHVLPSGEARGVAWHWTVEFDAQSGTYTATVADAAGWGFSTSFSGTLQQSGTTVGSFGVMNGSIGDYQDLLFDSPTFETGN